jgi:hypothetical protein
MSAATTVNHVTHYVIHRNAPRLPAQRVPCEATPPSAQRSARVEGGKRRRRRPLASQCVGVEGVRLGADAQEQVAEALAQALYAELVEAQRLLREAPEGARSLPRAVVTVEGEP